jgi:N-methylhydantoinase B
MEGLADIWPSDPAAALCDEQGRVLECTSLAQLGPLGEAARTVLAQTRFRYEPGDTVLLNDPFSGGTRVQDLFCLRRTEVGVAAVRATVPDFGGDIFGAYNPHAVEVWAEGNRLTPIRIARGGEVTRDAFACAVLNSRTPKIFERILRSLLHAAEQLATETLEDRTESAAATVQTALAALGGRRSVVASTAIARADPPVVVVASASSESGRLVLNFEESAPQVPHYVNATRGVTISAALAALPDAASLPANDGLLDAIEVRTRPGTVVHAAYPAPTARGPHLTATAVTSVVSTLLGTRLPIKPSTRLLNTDGSLDATIAERIQRAETAGQAS